jgi:hypothetical protein
MSSSISGDVVQRGKLLVHIAENGHSFELQCDECTVVEEVQRFLESAAGISYNDQLLLCLDMKLESQKSLSAYKLPSDDGREVYLFNKGRMRTNSPVPSPKAIEMIEISDPQPPTSSLNPHPLDDATDPALKALPSYERQFRYHYNLGFAVFSRTQVKIEACEKLFREQKVQEKALEIAKANLDHFYKMILQTYMDFIKHHSLQHRIHSNLLANFGRDLEKLKSCKLIPCLQMNNRKCLLDFVKEENLRKVVEDCSSSHRQFETKVAEFKQEFSELKESTEHLFSNRASFLTRDLEQTIKNHHRYLDEQKTIMQALSKDVGMVKKLVDDCLSNNISSSLRPHDAVSALGPMYEGHEKRYIPKMQSCEQSITQLLDFCKSKKDEMNVFVHTYMQKIAFIQYTIKDVRFKFSVFTEALKRQSEQFEHLKIIRGIGPAYRACLAEVVKRKALMKLYMGTAGQLAEKLATKREDEVRRREEFLKIHSVYIPRDILAAMGLFDNPSPCDVNIAPFDTSLIGIDISDIERYAPEYLLGLKPESSRVSDDVSDEILDMSELVEIAGTSKIEVENAKLKAELASAIAMICSFCPDIEYESLDDSKMDDLLKDAKEKTAEALRLKDEYEIHLRSMLKAKQMQCESYEKRIQELENRLSDRYKEDDDEKDDNVSKSEICGGHMPESMDDVSKSEICENMDDCSSGNVMMNPHLDSSMVEPGPGLTLDGLTADSVVDQGLESNVGGGDMIESEKLDNMDPKILALMEEIEDLRKELETSQKLVNESQINCAELENCLHQAREEAQTHMCAADRRAGEYKVLRTSTIKMRGLFERLRACVSSTGVSAFAESLRLLAQYMNNITSENDDDGIAEFHECIKGLSDKVTILSRHRAELLERYSKAEAANSQISKELEEKKELVNTLYIKHQHEKQVSKEKISLGRLEVHEIAAFVLNSSGQYEAINRNCALYYLSTESVALFSDHTQRRPPYIIGQIVHIEHKSTPTGRPDNTEFQPCETGLTGSNPYGVPAGCDYFVVTVAMLPETAAAVNSPATS